MAIPRTSPLPSTQVGQVGRKRIKTNNFQPFSGVEHSNPYLEIAESPIIHDMASHCLRADTRMTDKKRLKHVVIEVKVELILGKLKAALGSIEPTKENLEKQVQLLLAMVDKHPCWVNSHAIIELLDTKFPDFNLDCLPRSFVDSKLARYDITTKLKMLRYIERKQNERPPTSMSQIARNLDVSLEMANSIKAGAAEIRRKQLIIRDAAEYISNVNKGTIHSIQEPSLSQRPSQANGYFGSMLSLPTRDAPSLPLLDSPQNKKVNKRPRELEQDVPESHSDTEEVLIPPLNQSQIEGINALLRELSQDTGYFSDI